MRDGHTLTAQANRAIDIIDGNKPAKKARFVKTEGQDATLDEASLERARGLVGLKGYVTNITVAVIPAEEIISSYHDPWHVEQSFRMSKTVLAARPIFHHTRDAIEAHLTIVFAALAIARDLQARTGCRSRKSFKPYDRCNTSPSSSAIKNSRPNPPSPIAPQECCNHWGTKEVQLGRHLLRARQEHLTEKQHTRLHAAFTADERHVEVEVAYRCSQALRSVYHQPTKALGRAVAEKVVAAFHTCPIPEIRRLGNTLKQWRTTFLAYFTTDGASNGGTEAINGLIELARASPAGSATARTTASECY